MQIRSQGFSIGIGVKIYVKHTWAIEIPPASRIRGSPQGRTENPPKRDPSVAWKDPFGYIGDIPYEKP